MKAGIGINVSVCVVVVVVVVVCRELLVSGVVDANAILDKYSPTSALVRACDRGLTNFAKTLIDHGAQVQLSFHWVGRQSVPSSIPHLT